MSRILSKFTLTIAVTVSLLSVAGKASSAVLFSTAPPYALSVLGGVPIFGSGSSQATFGTDWALSAASQFVVTDSHWKIESLGIYAAGPSALGFPASPQTISLRIAADIGTGIPASGFLSSYSISGIDAEDLYTVLTPGLTLTTGTYWLEMLPATNAVDDQTMVAWNRVNSIGNVSGSFDFGSSWIQKPESEQSAFTISGNVPEPATGYLLCIAGAALVCTNRYKRKDAV